jgi:hypothetical protein
VDVSVDTGSLIVGVGVIGQHSVRGWVVGASVVVAFSIRCWGQGATLPTPSHGFQSWFQACSGHGDQVVVSSTSALSFCAIADVRGVANSKR